MSPKISIHSWYWSLLGVTASERFSSFILNYQIFTVFKNRFSTSFSSHCLHVSANLMNPNRTCAILIKEQHLVQGWSKGCRERLCPLLAEVHFNDSALFFYRKFAIPRNAGGKFAHLQPRINKRCLFSIALQWGLLDWENERHKLQDFKPRGWHKWHRARAHLLANSKQHRPWCYQMVLPEYLFFP